MVERNLAHPANVDEDAFAAVIAETKPTKWSIKDIIA